MAKKLLSVLIAALMIFSTMSITAFANETNVAEVNDTQYTTLQAAIDAANAGDTVTLIADVTDESVTVDKNLTIDGAGFDINVSKADRAINVTAKVTLVLNNVNIFVTGGVTDSSNIYGVYLDNWYATLTAKDSTITVDTPDYVAKAIFSNAQYQVVNIEGGKISTSGQDGSVAIQAHTVSAEGCEIVTNEKCYENLGGIYDNNVAINVSKGAVTLKDCKITTNGEGSEMVQATQMNTSTFNIENVTFERKNNEDETDAAIFALLIATYNHDITINVNGGSFTGVDTFMTNYVDTKVTPNVTGGTFSFDVSDYVADGYEYDTETGVVEAAPVTGLSGSGTEEDPYLISNIEELKWFRDSVNTYASDGSNQYKGKYVKLTADIDLDGENWTPIGTNSVGDHMAFLGTFDGGGHTISNLYINGDGDHLGFFARVGSYGEDVTPTVKNIKFNNVDVSSNTTTGHGGSYVGGVIANAGGNSVVSNVTVTGDVYVVGYGYVGGIVGHGYPDIDNCSVEANDGSWLHAYYWCAGGIIGYAGEGGTPITNCSVSGMDIWSAYGGAAAVAGLLQDGNELDNVSASNVEITSASDYCMGYIAGNGEASAMTGITVENVTATANGKEITVTDAVASIDGAIYFDLQTALGAGGNITLLRDVTVTEALTVDKDVILDLGGKTITSSASIQINSGNVTIKNGTIDSTTHAIRLGVTGAADDSATSVVLNIESDAAINADGCAVITFAGTLNTAGNLSNSSVDTGSGSVAIIQGNGNANNGGTIINITGGSITGPEGDSMALYIPQNGELNISGGTITAGSGIFVKNGKVSVTGGTIEATYIAEDNETQGNGASTTGIAFVVEASDAYGVPEVSITGGNFISRNSVAVGSFADENNTPVTGFISGGTFTGTTAPDANLAAAGYKFADNGDGTYGVTEAEKTKWTTDTDAGYYTVGTEIFGLMRFLFHTDYEGEIAGSGIRYFNSVDITKDVAAGKGGVSGSEKAFYGDIVGVPYGTNSTYYAIAYIVIGNGETAEYIWSEAVDCTPVFEGEGKDFTKFVTSTYSTDIIGGSN